MRSVFACVLLILAGSEAFAPAGRWVGPSTLSAPTASGGPRRAHVLAKGNQPAVLRANAMPNLVEGTCLVSGFFDDPARSDQTIFDYLHKHDTFSKIVAYTEDVAFAKKRLVGRSARYTGLLDVLDFKEGAAAQLPEALQGADCWVAFNVPLAEVAAQAAVARAAGVKKLVVVAVAGDAPADFSDAAAALAGSATAFTFLAVASLDAAGKGGGGVVCAPTMPRAAEAGGGASTCTGPFPRDEAIRFAAEAVLLPPAHNAAFTLASGDEEALAYQRDLRAKGFTRPEEVGFLMTGGFQEHLAKVETEKAEKAQKEADAEAKRNAPVDPVAQAAAILEARERWDKERDAECEVNILKKAVAETRLAYLAQRYMKAPVEMGCGMGFLSKIYGEVNEEAYTKAVYPLIEAFVRENADFDQRNNVILLTEEDKLRAKDIAEGKRKQAEMRAREEEEEEEAMKVVIDGVTYLGFEVGTKLFMLDEDGEKIVGKWNFKTDSMDPYIKGEEKEAFEEEDRGEFIELPEELVAKLEAKEEKEEQEKKEKMLAAALGPSADVAEKDE